MADDKKNPLVEILSKKLKKVKQEEYRLDDANFMFVVSNAGEFTPFKIGDDKFVNLTTGDKYDFPLVFKGHSPVEHSLCKSLGLEYGTDGQVLSSFQELLTATLSLPNVGKSKILNDFKKYLKQFPTQNPQNAEKMFCNKNSYTMEDVVDFGNATGKAFADKIKVQAEQDESSSVM